MIPLPVPVLSVPILAASAASNAARGPGGTTPPDHAGVASFTETEWVSVKSGSLKANVPLDGAALPVTGSVPERNPATTSWSPVKASAAAEVVMTGTSLVPVIVIVNGLTVTASFGAKLLSTRAR